MNKHFRTAALAALSLGALLAASSASADIVFQTGTPGSGPNNGGYSLYGDGTDGGSNFIGAGFTITGGPVSSLVVGLNADANFSDGTIFAEIIALPASGSLPSVSGGNLAAWLQQNTVNLGEATISAPAVSGDVSTVITFASALAAGNYAIVFGSGLYGTSTPDGWSMTGNNTTVGAPNIFASFGGDDFSAQIGDSGIRVYAQTPVPLPAALPLLGSGLAAGLAFVRRRRSVKAVK